MAGALVSHFLRHIGRVSCVVSEWEVEYQQRVTDEKGLLKWTTCSRAEANEAQFIQARISCVLDFVNTKSVDTSVRGLCIAFRKDNGDFLAVTTPFVPTEHYAGNRNTNRITSVSLPSGSLTSLKVSSSASDSGTRHMINGGRMDVFGYLPNKKTFHHQIDPNRDSFSPVAPLSVRDQYAAQNE